jgi:hypothetical protein
MTSSPFIGRSGEKRNTCQTKATKYPNLHAPTLQVAVSVGVLFSTPTFVDGTSVIARPL